MSLEILRENNLATTLVSVGRLLQDEKQVTITKDNHEWIISYNTGPAYKTVAEDIGEA